MTGQPPVTLDWLTYHWGDVYLIHYARDRWAALRRDTHQFLAAATLDELAAAIAADYEACPAPRDSGPPGSDDNLPGPDGNGDGDGDGNSPADLLTGLRDTFPQWAISYSPQTCAWTARNGSGTICQNSPALLCIALARIERRQRQARHRHGPNRDWPSGEDTSPS